MLDLLPLLLGARGVSRYRLLIGIIALASMGTGIYLALHINAEPNLLVHWLAIAFALILLATLWIGIFRPTNAAFTRSRLNQPRLFLIGFTALALLFGMSQFSAWFDLLWGEIIGVIFIINAIIFILFSIMIRPMRWQLQCLKGFLYLFLSAFFVFDFIPDYQKPRLFLSILLIVFSLSCIRVIVRRGRLTNPAIPMFKTGSFTENDLGPLRADDGRPVPIKIRIWLTESEQIVPYPYIAELWNFFTSTLSPHRANSGPTAHHATLECGSDVYISFCPQNDLAHMDPSKSSASNMKRAIRMDQHYRMPARWRISFKDDLELRGEPTHTVLIEDYSYQRLLHYQKYARQELTYHITRQNCCTTVVDAVDAAICAWYSQYQRNGFLLTKLILNDLFWQAASIRFRARSFAWTTTGLLKYSQAISGLLQLSGTVK